ncbi:unnamed protein product [Malus baccata var. baccata]
MELPNRIRHGFLLDCLLVAVWKLNCRNSKVLNHLLAYYQELNPSSGSCYHLCSVDETSSEEFKARYRPKTDLLKAIAVFAAAGTGAVAIYHSWVAANQDVAMALLFGIGYVGIIFEESLAFNKSGVGLLMAVSLWAVRSIGAPSTDIAVSELQHAFAEVSEIVFFLLGAMTIVEIVDSHQGFKLVTDNITTRKPRTLLWVVGFVTFLLSSILDNLTSTIFMVSLFAKISSSVRISQVCSNHLLYIFCMLLGAVVVIAANAGGAWTPIGDVTTTMLWIHGQISTLETMKTLFIPSAVCLAVPLALMSLTSGVSGEGPDTSDVMASEEMAPRGQLVFSVGIGALVFVPVFKSLTGLPPYMGMLLGLGVLWILTDAIHYGESERHRLKVPQALSRIDTQGALFFLGILLSVRSFKLITATQKLSAACKKLSMLVIGSAAGVAFMGMEKVDFFWYLRKVSGFALAGYAAGFAAYLAVQNLHISLPTTLAQVPFISGS